MSDDIPIYPWFDQAPDHLKTKRQLAEVGLRPGGPVVARVVWRRGQRCADLYDATVAVTKRTPTVAQRAALAKAHQARCTCPVCGTVFRFVLGPRWIPERDCVTCQEQLHQAECHQIRTEIRELLSDETAIILDLETTDLDGYIVQLAIITLDGRIVLDTLVNPMHPISAEAQQVHGLTTEWVQDAPVFADLVDDLTRLLHHRPVCVYNVDFEYAILYNEIVRREQAQGNVEMAYAHAGAWVKAVDWYDAMDWYSTYRGYRQRLPGGDHTALGDCRATLALLQSLVSEGSEP